MGHAIPLNIEQTKENIVINYGQCLSKESADAKLKQIEELFKVD